MSTKFREQISMSQLSNGTKAIKLEMEYYR